MPIPRQTRLRSAKQRRLVESTVQAIDDAREFRRQFTKIRAIISDVDERIDSRRQRAKDCDQPYKRDEIMREIRLMESIIKPFRNIVRQKRVVEIT